MQNPTNTTSPAAGCGHYHSPITEAELGQYWTQEQVDAAMVDLFIPEGDCWSLEECVSLALEIQDERACESRS